MRHRRSRHKLNRSSAHRKSMGANLATALLTHGRIQTTLPKARLAREVAERAITLGKDGSLHARRQAISLLRNKEITYSLFDRIAPAFRDVNGGYTRTLKLGPRSGDAAEMVLLELTRDLDAAPAAEAEAPPRRRRRRGRGDDEASAAAPAAVEVADGEDEPVVAEDAETAPEAEEVDDAPVADADEVDDAPVADADEVDAPVAEEEDDAPVAEAEDDSSEDDDSDEDASDDDDGAEDEADDEDEAEADEPAGDDDDSADAEEDRARE